MQICKPSPVMTAREIPIDANETTIVKVTAQADRVARQTVWENYHAELLKFKNTLATNLTTSIKQNVFQSQVRKHNSALDMMLYEHNIPTSVFHNLIDVFKKNIPCLAALLRNPPQGAWLGNTRTLRYVGPTDRRTSRDHSF